MATSNRLHFFKMHGCGNDYIYFDCFEQQVRDPEALSIRLSDRHFGVGGDGIVLICPHPTEDAEMRMFNADGSEGKMCGNAIRCVGKYLHDLRGVDKEVVTVQTKSGVKRLRLTVQDGVATHAEVNMGQAELVPARIPVSMPGERAIDCPLTVDGRDWQVTCVSMGNPHCVVFMDEPVDALPLEVMGPPFENHPLFPERINTEFIHQIDAHTLQMRVWERGSGETLACGTGACAAVVAAVENGRCPRGEAVTVRLRGGDLTIRYEADGTVYMTGPATLVFDGYVNED